jgi:hypothetical protein
VMEPVVSRGGGPRHCAWSCCYSLSIIYQIPGLLVELTRTRHTFWGCTIKILHISIECPWSSRSFSILWRIPEPALNPKDSQRSHSVLWTHGTKHCADRSLLNFQVLTHALFDCLEQSGHFRILLKHLVYRRLVWSYGAVSCLETLVFSSTEILSCMLNDRRRMDVTRW